jgi:hypothetical protein
LAGDPLKDSPANKSIVTRRDDDIK